MNIKEIRQQKIREVLEKYFTNDPLKPEYNGMTRWELAGIILREADMPTDEQMNDMYETSQTESEAYRLAH